MTVAHIISYRITIHLSTLSNTLNALWVPSSGFEPPRLSAQALNLLRIPFRHEGKA